MMRGHGSYLLPAILAATLAGCKMPATTTRPPYAVDVNQKGRAAGPDGNYSTVKVNAFENVSERATWLEDRLDVPCTISSEYFSKDILAPAIVNIPTFGDKTPDLKVRCTYNGKSVERESGVFVLRNGNIEYADQSIIFD